MVARKFNNEPKEAVRISSNVMFYSLLIAFPIAVGGTTLSGPIINFLYKNSFAEASTSLRILIWWVPISFATNTLGHILAAIGQQKKVFYISAMNAILNVAVNLYFIPRFGAVGASITTVATEVIGIVFLTSIVTKQFGWVYQMGRLAKTCIASLVLLPLSLLSDKLHIIILTASGAILYFAALIMLRAITKKDIDQLKFIIFNRNTHII
jgi:O-antigen/teichoic acid export membrane protein